MTLICIYHLPRISSAVICICRNRVWRKDPPDVVEVRGFGLGLPGFCLTLWRCQLRLIKVTTLTLLFRGISGPRSIAEHRRLHFWVIKTAQMSYHHRRKEYSSRIGDLSSPVVSNIGETVGDRGNTHNMWPVCNLTHSLPQWLLCFASYTRPVEEQQTVRAARMRPLNFAIADADSCSSAWLLLCNLVENADGKSDVLKSRDPRRLSTFPWKIMTSSRADASGELSAASRAVWTCGLESTLCTCTAGFWFLWKWVFLRTHCSFIVA